MVALHEVNLVWPISAEQMERALAITKTVKTEMMKITKGGDREQYEFRGNMLGLVDAYDPRDYNFHLHEEKMEISYRGTREYFDLLICDKVKAILGEDYAKVRPRVNYYARGVRWYETELESLIRRYKEGGIKKSSLFSMKKHNQECWHELWAWICHSENLHAIESPKPGTPAYRQAQAAGKLEEIRAHNDFMALGKL